ncbi:HTH-type transcriptional regulatory protein gabR [Actinomyces bovis]|uniref:HTH-type transcriptional regulatory protein gabR n=1 Tax=Actinomyces bovis TaxID=1658 RepID=A0ABY1VL12_9ACTO|nr:PLP-dependent aminotransferase family protein [Actinomyces bovis]SPT52371.1 HTH-type transcriptional regulatory protein gabR [Actinomyces bovis]VEG53952.1 HTH-type transcriptional regulatory protein gabR [Actinomyces israelii]
MALDRRRPLPEQVVSMLRRRVLAGELLPGDLLPSTRNLAEELGVSRGTVVTAYEQLQGEGFLVATRGGTRVDPALPQLPRRRHSQKARRSITEPTDLRPGTPLTGALTTSLWRACWRAAAADPHPHPTAGSEELRSLLAQHLRQTRYVDISPEQVLVTAGARDGLRLVLTALGQAGRRPCLVVEEPGYPSLRQVPRALGWKLTPFSQAHYEEPGLYGAVLVTPNHQFPWGRQAPAAERLALLTQARSWGAMLIEDDYDAELRRSPAPLLALDPGDQVAFLGSFAKILTPALGLGFVVVPERIAPKLAELCVPVSGLVQDAMTRFLAADGLRRHLARTRREDRWRRALFQEIFPQAVPMEGGLHAIIPLEDSQQERLVLGRCRKAGLGVQGLSHYWSAPESGAPSGLVVGLGSRSRERLRALLLVLKKQLP